MWKTFYIRKIRYINTLPKIKCFKCGSLMPYDANTDLFTCLNCNNVKRGRDIVEKKQKKKHKMY